jgi:hypothetical protein
MAYLDPLPADAEPELEEEFELFEEVLGFVPNSLLTMQRKPAIVAGFHALTEAVMEEADEVDDEIVELLAAISLYGFLNRWNDTLATDLEDGPRQTGEQVLGEEWDPGKHVED